MKHREEKNEVVLIAKHGPLPGSALDRYLILAREAGAAARSLVRVLEPLGRVEVIVDRPVAACREHQTVSGEGYARDFQFGVDSSASTVADRRYIHIPDGEAAGYEGLMGSVSDLPPITAWSRALVHLSRSLKDNEWVWLVEDDVAGDAESFARLVELTRSRNADLSAMEIRLREEDPEWYFWPDADQWIEDPCRAFQPLCRVSPSLIRAILGFRGKHGRFVFHELLFASLARRDGMSMLDWNEHEEFGCIFPVFRYRPEVNAVTRGNSHPVKEARAHEAICSIPPAGFKRMVNASLQGWAILQEDYLFLARLCRKHSFTRIVEFGPGDSTRAFLDAGCKVVSYEHDIGWLHRSVEMFEGEPDVELIHCPEGTVPDAGPFDPGIVFVDGPPFREGQEMSRLQPCEWALDACGCFLLHDANRHGEQGTLREMERRGMHVARIPTRKGLAMVVDPARRPETISAVGSRSDQSREESNKEWFADEFFAWSVMFHQSWDAVKVLETGVSAGVGVRLMLEQIFVHPESEIHGIDLYEGAAGDQLREDFKSNAESGGHTGQIHLYEGTTREVLAWMIAEDGFWESFDFIHLNCANDAADLLSDACQAWSLLKSGGILILAGGAAAMPGRDAFLSVYGDRGKMLFDGNRVAAMKVQ